MARGLAAAGLAQGFMQGFSFARDMRMQDEQFKMQKEDRAAAQEDRARQRQREDELYPIQKETAQLGLDNAKLAKEANEFRLATAKQQNALPKVQTFVARWEEAGKTGDYSKITDEEIAEADENLKPFGISLSRMASPQYHEAAAVLENYAKSGGKEVTNDLIPAFDFVFSDHINKGESELKAGKKVIGMDGKEISLPAGTKITDRHAADVKMDKDGNVTIALAVDYQDPDGKKGTYLARATKGRGTDEKAETLKIPAKDVLRVFQGQQVLARGLLSDDNARARLTQYLEGYGPEGKVRRLGKPGEYYVDAKGGVRQLPGDPNGGGGGLSASGAASHYRGLLNTGLGHIGKAYGGKFNPQTQTWVYDDPLATRKATAASELFSAMLYKEKQGDPIEFAASAMKFANKMPDPKKAPAEFDRWQKEYDKQVSGVRGKQGGLEAAAQGKSDGGAPPFHAGFIWTGGYTPEGAPVYVEEGEDPEDADSETFVFD